MNACRAGSDDGCEKRMISCDNVMHVHICAGNKHTKDGDDMLDMHDHAR